jgi:integrase
LRRTSSKLSGRWRTVARLAKCHDLHFHDLRHEATSRIYERTTLTDLQIAKITGHKDLKSLQRYANLRASSLAERLW